MNPVDVILLMGGIVAVGGLVLVLWDRISVKKHHRS